MLPSLYSNFGEHGQIQWWSDRRPRPGDSARNVEAQLKLLDNLDVFYGPIREDSGVHQSIGHGILDNSGEAIRDVLGLEAVGVRVVLDEILSSLADSKITNVDQIVAVPEFEEM